MKRLKKLPGFIFSLIIMLALPFWLLFRGTIYLYQEYAWWVVFGMLAMSVIVFFVLLIYVAMIWDSVLGANKITRRSIKGKMWFVFILMVGYLGYTAFSFSAANAKSETVANEFQELHPLLRMSVGTFIFLDPSLMVTDMARVPEDYAEMGLSTKSQSLHYKQEDGYVHAVDLRTKDRPEWKNTLLKGYFWFLGFRTLRHTGTADHLHISLVWPDAPGRI